MEFTPEILDRLAPTAEGIPVYIDDSDPEIEDPAQKLDVHQWRPANLAASKLTRSLEAVRDVSSTLTPLSTSAALHAERRLAKQVVIPVHNLAIAVRDLYNYVQSTCWPQLGKKRQQLLVKRFERFGEIVPTKKGVLKDVRDKIAAHLDKDLWTTEYRQYWDSFSLIKLLGWINGSL